MQDDDAENNEPACGDLAFVQSDDNGDDQDDTADGDKWQGIAQELQMAVEEAVHHHAGDDGQQYGFQNRHHHFACCNIHAGVRVELQQERR